MGAPVGLSVETDDVDHPDLLDPLRNEVDLGAEEGRVNVGGPPVEEADRYGPVGLQFGVDPVHLGIIMTVSMEIGMITPPVGLNLFVTSGIAKLPVTAVIRAAMPWLVVLLIALVIVTYVPWVSLVLLQWLN